MVAKEDNQGVCCVCLVAQSCPILCNPMDDSLPGSSVHGESPGKSTGVGGQALLLGIFSAQGSNAGLLHCRRILYHLSHQGSPLFSSVAQLYLTLCDPIDYSMPVLPVHHLPGACSNSCPSVNDAIQPSHPRSSPSPPAHNPSQHQSLFQ